MGLNLDMASMLDLPTEVQCPKCQAEAYAYFDDLDMDCRSANPKPGVLQLTNVCSECEYEFTVKANITHTIEVS